MLCPGSPFPRHLPPPSPSGSRKSRLSSSSRRTTGSLQPPSPSSSRKTTSSLQPPSPSSSRKTTSSLQPPSPSSSRKTTSSLQPPSPSSSRRTAGSSSSQRSAIVSYRSTTTSTQGLFGKKTRQEVNCSFDREIAAASGEWVNEFIPNNGKRKSSAKLYVPSTAELLKRNIKRSWTISNPSGTGGPQLTPRNEPPGPAQEPPRIAPMLDERGARPTIVAQIPPPPHRQSRPQGGPPPQQKQRSAPVRSQSMGVADTGRFYMKAGMGVSGPPPRFRPPPPPEERRPVVHRRGDYNETSSEGEEGNWEPPLVPDYRSWDRRKTQQYASPHPPKYKTLENPRSRSGGDAQSLERLNSARRVLPEVPRDPREQFPSQSLPRPGSKRAQSHSVQRPGAQDQELARRSHSHGDGLGPEARRKLPSVPGRMKDRDLREPTPDYDVSPPPSESSRLTGRRNSDSGIPGSQPQGAPVRRHASSVEKVTRRPSSQSSPENNMDSDDSARKDSVCMSSTNDAGAMALLSSKHVSRPPIVLASNTLSTPATPVLLTIHESGEDLISSEEDDEDVPIGHFTRGTLERSTSRSQRLKNFKGLRIDLIAAKSRMMVVTGAAAQLRKDKENSKVDERKIEICSTADSLTTCDSDFYPYDYEFDVEESINEKDAKLSELSDYPSDFEEEMEKSIQETDKKIEKLRKSDSVGSNEQESITKGKQVAYIETKSLQAKEKVFKEEKISSGEDEKEDIFQTLSEQISSDLSGDEEAFDTLSLSMDISENLSEDEDVFDRLSMCLQFHDEKSPTEEQKANDSSKLEEKMVEQTVSTSKGEKEKVVFDAEVTRSRDIISYWENRLSANNTNTKSRRKMSVPGPVSQTNKQVLEPLPNKETKTNEQETLSKPLSITTSKTPPKLALQNQYPEPFQRSTLQRSTIKRSKARVNKAEVVVVQSQSTAGESEISKTTFRPVPIPRKRTSITKKEDSATPAKALKDDDIARKISDSLEMRNKGNPYVSIKTWEERSKEPGRTLPQKQIIEWF